MICSRIKKYSGFQHKSNVIFVQTPFSPRHLFYLHPKAAEMPFIKLLGSAKTATRFNSLVKKLLPSKKKLSLVSGIVSLLNQAHKMNGAEKYTSIH